MKEQTSESETKWICVLLAAGDEHADADEELTYAALRKAHRQFRHPGKREFLKMIETAGRKYKAKDSERLHKECEPCRAAGQMGKRPVASGQVFGWPRQQ